MKNLALVLLLTQSTSVAFADKLDSVSISKDKSMTLFNSQTNVKSLAGVSGSDSFAGEDRLVFESVLGSDDRFQIGSDAIPARTVGRLAQVGCTGTLVGPRHVLTAAHCIYSLERKIFTNNYDFSPAENNYPSGTISRPYGTIAWKHASIPTEYINSGKSEFDFGMIILNEPIGEKVGWLGFAYNDGLKVRTSLHIMGYSGDKPEGTLMLSTCEIRNIDQLFIWHDCDTYGGNSGSAIIPFGSLAPDTAVRVYGVHTNGIGADQTFPFNKGTRFNKANFDMLLSWKNANP